MIALQRVLVPHDFSETSAASVTYAVALARSFGAELTFLYVGDRSQIENEIPVSEDGSVREVARERLLTMLAPADRIALNPQFFVRAGTPATEIARFASEHDTDLIVMGTHGRGLVGHMVMGSVAEKVVRIAPCPVLTVRNPVQAQGMEVVVDAAAAVPAAV
jgi:universal stress protein A